MKSRYIVVLLIICMCISGCGKTDSDTKYLYDAFENLKNVEAGEITIDHIAEINGFSSIYSNLHGYTKYEYTKKQNILNYTVTSVLVSSERPSEIIGYEAISMGTTDYDKKITTDVYIYDDQGYLKEIFREDDVFYDPFRSFSDVFDLADKHKIKNIRDMALIEITENDEENTVYTINFTENFIDKENAYRKSHPTENDVKFYMKKATYIYEINKSGIMISCIENVSYECFENENVFEYNDLRLTYFK